MAQGVGILTVYWRLRSNESHVRPSCVLRAARSFDLPPLEPGLRDSHFADEHAAAAPEGQ